ncbi:MAG: hypothetical protein E6G27_10475 [Actinobacteria bacterium]|nr:MAG: hypothetical protein E6G27_10475 [Actinomycetota bacterium]
MTTSISLPLASGVRSKVIVVASSLRTPATFPRPQSDAGRLLHAPAVAGCHGPVVEQATTAGGPED